MNVEIPEFRFLMEFEKGYTQVERKVVIKPLEILFSQSVRQLCRFV